MRQGAVTTGVATPFTRPTLGWWLTLKGKLAHHSPLLRFCCEFLWRPLNTYRLETQSELSVSEVLKKKHWDTLLGTVGYGLLWIDVTRQALLSTSAKCQDHGSCVIGAVGAEFVFVGLLCSTTMSVGISRSEVIRLYNWWVFSIHTIPHNWSEVYNKIQQIIIFVINYMFDLRFFDAWEIVICLKHQFRISL